METSAVTITKEEYELLVEAKIRLGLVQNYVENETYYNRVNLRSLLGMPNEEKE